MQPTKGLERSNMTELNNHDNDRYSSTVLMISQRRDDVSYMLSRLEEAVHEDRYYDKLVLSGLVLTDELVLDSLAMALTPTKTTTTTTTTAAATRRRCYWKSVHLGIIHRSIKPVLHLLCTVGITKYQQIKDLNLLLHNQELDVDDWSTIAQCIVMDAHECNENRMTKTSTPLTCLRLTTELTVRGIQILSKGLSCQESTSMLLCTLQTLDLSNCSIDISNNGVVDGDTIIQQLADALRKNNTLDTFIARHCGFSDCQMATIIRSFIRDDGNHVRSGDYSSSSSSRSPLTHLYLDSNKGGSMTSQALADLLSDGNSILQTLTVSNQKPCHRYRRSPQEETTEEDRQCRLNVPIIARAILEHNARRLKVLDMSDCFVDDTDLDSLINVLIGGRGDSIGEDEGDTAATPGHGSVLSNTLRNGLEQLIIHRNLITDEGLKQLGMKLPLIHGLKSLSLWGNPFDEVGVQALCCGLQRNMDLVHIDLFQKFSCTETIKYYTLLNKAGRRLLHEGMAAAATTTTMTMMSDKFSTGRDIEILDEADHTESADSTCCTVQNNKAVPLGLWPIVLERLQSIKLPSDSDCVKWDIVPSPIVNTTPHAKATDLRHTDLIYYMIRGPALLHS
jgi:hypothetical protein